MKSWLGLGFPMFFARISQEQKLREASSRFVPILLYSDVLRSKRGKGKNDQRSDRVIKS